MTGSSGSMQPPAHVRVDGMLAVIALVAVAVVVGSLLPSGNTAEDGAAPLGLYRLGETDRLLVLEDYTYGPGGWTEGTIDRRNAEHGAVLRPAGRRLERVFEIPMRADQVQVQFDTIGLASANDLTVLAGSDMEIAVTDLSDTRLRYVLKIPQPPSSLVMTLEANIDGPWAIDNLLVVAQ